MTNDAVIPPSILNVLRESDQQSTLRAVCEEACRILEAQRAMVALLSSDEQERTPRKIVYTHHLPGTYVELLRAKSSPTLVNDVCKNGQMAVIAEPGSNPKFLDPKYQNNRPILEAGHRAICIIPLKKDHKTYGALCLYHLYRRDYTFAERKLAQDFGEWASVAIDKAKETESLGLRIEEREGLTLSLRRFTSCGGVDETVAAVWDEAERMMGTNRSTIEWHHSETDEIFFFGSPEISSGYGDRLSTLSQPFPITRVFLSNHVDQSPVVIHDASPIHLMGEIPLQEGHRSTVAFPIRVEGKNKGSLMFHWTTPKEFSEEILSLGQAFADQVAIGLHSAFQRKATSQYMDQLKELTQVASELSSPSDFDSVCELAGRSGAKLLEAERWGVWLLEPGGQCRCVKFEGLSELFIRSLSSQDVFKSLHPVEGKVAPFGRGDDTDLYDFPGRSIHSFLLLPIQNSEARKGWISYYFNKPIHLPQQRIQIAQSCTEHVARSFEYIRLFAQSEEHLKNLQVVGEVSKAVATLMEPKELFQAIVKKIRKVIPCERCLISAVSSESLQMEHWYNESDTPFISKETDELEIGGWFYREVYETKQFLNIPNLKESGLFWAGHFVQGGIQSLLVIPILLENEVVAHLSLGSRYPGAFSTAHEKLLTEIASQLGVAIQNGSRYRKAEDRVFQLTALNRIIKSMGASLDPGSIFENLIQEIREAVPCERVIISMGALQNEEDRHVHGHSDLEVSESVDREKNYLDWLSREIYQSKQTQNIPLLHSSNLPWGGSLIRAGFKSVIFVPVVYEGESIAHLELYSTREAAFSRDQQDFLSSVVFHIGPTIRNASLYRTKERQADRLRQLNEINHRLSETLDLSSVLNNIQSGAIDLLGGDFSQLFLTDEKSQTLLPCSPFTEIPYPEVSPEAFSQFREVARGALDSGSPILEKDLQQGSQFAGMDWVVKAALHSLVVHPIRLGNESIGAICCASKKMAMYTDDDLSLLKTFTDNSAVVIQNARLHDHEKRSRIFFHSVVDDSSDAIIVADPHQKILVWNAAAEKLYGHTKSEALGTRVDDLILPKDKRIDWRKKFEEVLTSGKDWQLEEGRVHKDGTVIPVSITLSPVKHEDGQFIAMTGIHHDLRWKQQAESALRESEERFRQFIQCAGDTLIVYDLHGDIEEVNFHACQSLGYKREELLSMTMDKIDLKFDETNARAQLERIQSGEPITAEGLFRRNNGKIFPVEARLGVVELKGRSHFLALVRDISARKATEDSLREALENAEAANKAKREFLSTMSHELRSPLNLITGFSDLLMMQTQDKAVTDIIPKIQSSAKQIASLIEDMVDLDRVERGVVNLNLEVVSLNELVTDLVESRRPHLRAGFAIECILDPVEPHSYADPTRINQILTNLLENAIHYSPEGGKIQVRTSVQEQEIWVSIQDEGVGLSAEEKEKIFERFFRLEEGKVHRPGGLGIGLNLVRELVSLQGGRIWVTGEKGIGSTFTFTLPLSVPEEAQEIGSFPETKKNGRPSESVEPWAGKVVMVADDDDAHHLFIKEILKSAGRVVSAYDGGNVTEMVQSEHPDIILLDIRMPSLDGLTVIEILRSDSKTKDIPILVLTARATPDDREAAISKGANGFLTKPLVVEELYKEMRRLVGSKS